MIFIIFRRAGSDYVFAKIISPGTLFVVFWLVFLYARQFGTALLNIDSITSCISIVGETMKVIDVCIF